MNTNKYESFINDNKLFLGCVTEELIARGFGPDGPFASGDVAEAMVFTRDRLAALMSDPRVKSALSKEIWVRIRTEEGLSID